MRKVAVRSLVVLVLFGCGGGGAPPPAAPPANEATRSCDGHHDVSLTFIYYGEEGSNETVAITCADRPRAVVDDTSADLTWPRWEQAWTAIEALDTTCRPSCPPEPDTAVEVRDADGTVVTSCMCASDGLVKSLLDAAVDAGLRPRHTP